MEPEDGLDLGPFVAATRRELDRVAHRQRLAGIPPAPPVPRRGPGVGVLVAAAVVLVGAAVLAAMGSDVLSSTMRSTASEAEHHAEPRGPALAAPHPSTPGRPALAVPVAAEPAVEPGPPPGSMDAPVAVADDEAPAGTVAPAGSPGASPPARTRPSLLAELQRLDAEAQRRWQAGDPEGAEALFLEIVDKGGRTRYAELAFGDLFTLASQAGDARREQQRWRRYLGRFPRGRFADDVRAWQCRRADGDAATACWRRYLDEWPRGTHRAEAGRMVELGGAP